MATFTVTIPNGQVPAVAADTPSWQRKPAQWIASASLITRYSNVYKLTDGTYTTKQPTSNVAFTSGWERVAVFYQGGTVVTVSDAEAAALIDAGYGAYVSGSNAYANTYTGAYV